MFFGIDRTSRFAFTRPVEKAGKMAAAQRLCDLIVAVPCRVHTILTDNVLCWDGFATQGVRSRGIRATGCPEDVCPSGFRRQEMVSPIANTGSAKLPPSPSLRRDPKSQADGGGSGNSPGDCFPDDTKHYLRGRRWRLHGSIERGPSARARPLADDVGNAAGRQPRQGRQGRSPGRSLEW